MEVPRRREALTDQARADDDAVALDERAVRLVREAELRDAGDRERVDDPEDDREGNEGEQRGEELAPHQTSPDAPTTRSISLIPMNGAITPPAP